MPFIDCKITKQLTDDEKDEIKTQLGRAVSIIHKPECYLMVGIADGYTLYMAGARVRSGAYVSVSLYGAVNAKAYDALTAEICKILQKYGVEGAHTYVTYHEIENWGYNGGNF